MAVEPGGCDLVIAGRKIPLGKAEQTVRAFPAATVLHYDLGGDPDAWPAPGNGLTVADLGRAMFLNAEIGATDAARLLEASISAPWDRVPPWATLGMADPAATDGLYDDALALYDHFHKIRNIGPAQVSKLLHLKRPALYPIVDQKVQDRYVKTGAPVASAKANHRSKARRWTQVFWDPIRDDFIANNGCLYELHQLFASAAAAGDQHASLLARLTPLRLLDILAR